MLLLLLLFLFAPVNLSARHDGLDHELIRGKSPWGVDSATGKDAVYYPYDRVGLCSKCMAKSFRCLFIHIERRHDCVLRRSGCLS